MRLTCHDCGSTIYISAEDPDCPECGADLSGHLAALDYVRACYRQASEETLAGDDERALSILAQGLSAVNASELHLLAALIHRKLGEYDGMHRHVAAIPVDDPLRPEGEWLLRSHQQRQRAVRQAQKEYDPPAHPGKAARQLSPEFYAAPPTLGKPLRPNRRLLGRRMRTIGVLAALLIAVVLLRQPLAQGFALLSGGLELPSQSSTPVTVSQAEPAVTVQSEAIVPVALPTATSTPTRTATPLPEPTQPVPVAVVSPTAEAAAPDDSRSIAAANDAVAAAVATASSNGFDLAAYLTEAERPDLAALPIEAQLLEGTLSLSGVVGLTSQRLEVLALVTEIPGVVEVNGVDLLVRLPDVYVVAEGDTLWTIAYYLYGDGTRWEEVYAANETLLGNSYLLNVGMELQVPER